LDENSAEIMRAFETVSRAQLQHTRSSASKIRLKRRKTVRRGRVAVVVSSAKEEDDDEEDDEPPPEVLPYIGGDLLPKETETHTSGYVAIVGRPNAGKSTLLNKILGTKLSIVTKKPQTTRHRILGVLSDEESQMVLLDTPGVMRSAFNKLDETMLKSVRSSVKTADCLIIVIDGDAKETAEKDFENLLDVDVIGKVPTAVCVNKCDRIKDVQRIKELMKYFRQVEGVSEVIPISALNDTGVKEVVQWAKGKLPVGPSYFSKEYLSEHPERFFVAEIIREKIFELYSQEVPYCSSVWVEELKERKPPAKDLIRATIYVERQSQVGIVVGEDGAAMKKLSTEARKDIEVFLERGVFLEMKVKSKPGWRSNDKSLTEFGLEDPNKTSNPDFRE
jgi:GTP-binding protein Era